jgi:HK97 family phage major capsid protein
MTFYDTPVSGKLDGNAMFAGREQHRSFPTILPSSALKTVEAGQRAAQMVLSVAAGARQRRDAVAISAERHGEGALVTRALQASIGSTGGYLIPNELSSELIDLLRPRTTVRRMTPLKNQIQIPRGNLTMNRLDGGASVSYQGEGQSTAYTQESVGQINFSARRPRRLCRSAMT